MYTGQTDNLEKRLARHNKELPTKKISYTSKQGNNWNIVYFEKFDSRMEAVRREKELKSGKGRDFLKTIIG